MSKIKAFFTKHDLAHKLIAILMAIALWFIVVANNDDLMRTYTIANIPITYTNEDTLESDYGLRLIEGQDQMVTVKVTGPYASLSSLTTNDIQVRVNLANFQKPGTYTINTSSQSTNCTLIVNSSSVRESEISTPNSFQIVIDEVITKEVPVTIQVDGTPSTGYMYDDPEGEQDSVSVTGPKTVVNQIRKATAVVPAEDSTGLTKTTSVLASFTFLDEKNQPVDQTHLTSEPNDYSVTIPVYAVAKLPLTINLISSDTVDKNSVKATIDPQEIAVYGAEEVISKLTAISLGDLQLSTVSLDEDDPITIPIELPAGVTRVQGEATSAKVTIQAVGMSTREMPVTRITLQNSGSDPNLTATLRTTSVNIRIQAETAALANLTADAFHVIAVFNADELGPGIHEVPIEVQCEQLESSNSSFTLLNPDEKVTIEIKQTGETATTTPTEENETT
ncbi:YbbR-like domain-containing protein [Butyricicoccus pullicaecorum]|uniref:CdaR family protein n=1 Tax=Butyricicoccus pullicaecorum TaxID=501571 RepID=UPI0035213717